MRRPRHRSRARGRRRRRRNRRAGHAGKHREVERSYTGVYLRPYLEKQRTSPFTPVLENVEAQPAVPAMRGHNAIAIVGAKEHNLKNISLNIPRDRFVVFTGLSGSGKSSLAFDIIYAEGQRRYIDSLSAYARQFLEVMARPNVDYVAGIPPTVAIEQRLSQGGKKSTVATVTEIYHYLRLLYSKIGKQHCVQCGRQIHCFVAQPNPRSHRPFVPRQRSYDSEPHRARPQRLSQRSHCRARGAWVIAARASTASSWTCARRS